MNISDETLLDKIKSIWMSRVKFCRSIFFHKNSLFCSYNKIEILTILAFTQRSASWRHPLRNINTFVHLVRSSIGMPSEDITRLDHRYVWRTDYTARAMHSCLFCTIQVETTTRFVDKIAAAPGLKYLFAVTFIIIICSNSFDFDPHQHITLILSSINPIHGSGGPRKYENEGPWNKMRQSVVRMLMSSAAFS